MLRVIESQSGAGIQNKTIKRREEDGESESNRLHQSGEEANASGDCL